MKKTVGIWAVLAVSGCAGGSKLSESQEYYVGRAMAAQSVADSKGICTDEALYDYVAKVGWSIALASDRPDTFLGYNFVVLQSEDVGAWAAPGGFVFVTTATLALMENEDQLAGVLAHEIGHVNLKHPEEVANDAARKAGVLDILAAAGEVAKLFAKPEASGDIDKLVQGLGGCVGDLMDRAHAGYSREYEMAADRAGVDYLTRGDVKYNPYALADFLARLPQRQGQGASGPYATHPGVAERIDAARREAQGTGAKAEINPSRTQRFQAITAALHR